MVVCSSVGTLLAPELHTAVLLVLDWSGSVHASANPTVNGAELSLLVNVSSLTLVCIDCLINGSSSLFVQLPHALSWGRYPTVWLRLQGCHLETELRTAVWQGFNSSATKWGLARPMVSGRDLFLSVKVSFTNAPTAKCVFYNQVSQFYSVWLRLSVSLYIAIQCLFLDSPRNGQVTLRGTTVGSQADYNCFPGFILSGVSTRTCQVTGEWSDQAPTCTGELNNSSNYTQRETSM